jgi:hypothetical protein
VNRWFLGFRARAFSVALICFGLAAVAPRGIQGFIGFLQAPPGLALIALVLVAVGQSVEETGTMKRIRFGIALRLVAAPVLVIACAWAAMLGSPMTSLTTMAFVLGGIGAIGFGLALQHDWATYADVRYGQPVKVLDISKAGIEIETQQGRVIVALTDILAVRAAANLDGRAVIFLVDAAARKRETLAALPWIGATAEGDAFVLTEHQAGMDVEVLVQRVLTSVSMVR